MKILDEYGNGRRAVIHEMIEWVDKEIEIVKAVESKDTHMSATLSGQIKAYIKVKEKLKVKYKKSLR